MFVRFINTVHRRQTVEKQRFRSCPEKKRENRWERLFCAVYSCGAPWRKNGVVRFSARRVEPHRRKNRSTGNRAKPHRTIYHSTEPHRRIYDICKTAPNCTVGSITAPHRTVGFTISAIRIKISAFLKPHRTGPYDFRFQKTAPCTDG